MPSRKVAVPPASESSMDLVLARIKADAPKGGSAASGTKVSPFLNKLFSMVSDESTDEMIHWAENGESFFVPNHERFGQEILPRFFKHSNFSSFVRQLNMYGFHKVPHLQTGVLAPNSASELWEFTNPNFRRDQPELLPLVQRKKHTPATQAASSSDQPIASGSGGSGSRPVATTAGGAQGSGSGPSSASVNGHLPSAPGLDLQTVLNGLTSIRASQSSLNSELKNLQTSNEHLWREAIASRERHRRHQDTTDRILRFLAGVFGPQAAEGLSAKGKEKAGDGKKGKRKIVVVPKNRRRLMIGDGTIGVESDADVSDGDAEEFELPYAEDDEEMEEISKNRFTEFSPGSTTSGKAPNNYTHASPSIIHSIDSPENTMNRFDELSSSVTPSGMTPKSEPRNGLELSLQQRQQTVAPFSSSSEPPPQAPLSPFSQWMNPDPSSIQSSIASLAAAGGSNPTPQQIMSPLGKSTSELELYKRQQQNGHRPPGVSGSTASDLQSYFEPTAPYGSPGVAGQIADHPYTFSPSASPLAASQSAVDVLSSNPLSPGTMATLQASMRHDPYSSNASQTAHTRHYQSTEAIEADVDAVQRSIDDLVASLGLDPEAGAQLKGELSSETPFDIDAFFRNYVASGPAQVPGLNGAADEAGDSRSLEDLPSEEIDRLLEATKGQLGEAEVFGAGNGGAGLLGDALSGATTPGRETTSGDVTPGGGRGIKRKSTGMLPDMPLSVDGEDADDVEEEAAGSTAAGRKKGKGKRRT